MQLGDLDAHQHRNSASRLESVRRREYLRIAAWLADRDGWRWPPDSGRCPIEQGSIAASCRPPDARAISSFGIGCFRAEN